MTGFKLNENGELVTPKLTFASVDEWFREYPACNMIGVVDWQYPNETTYIYRDGSVDRTETESNRV